jgi:hypothetical protein
MIHKFTNLLLILIFLSVSIKAQTTNVSTTVSPYGVTAYMVALSTTDIYDYKYTGLTNVGVGTKVYLIASEVGTKGTKAKISSTAAWTVSRKPSGSTAAIGTTKDAKNDSTQVVYFTADIAGTYSVTFTDGTFTQTLTFNAAKYLGYQNTVVNGVDTKLSCNTCHSDKVTAWQKTNHATMFTRAMSATPGISGSTDHYSSSCIKCHTTGWDDNTTAKNDGFDDMTFTYPTVITTTTYNTLLTQFPDAMKRGNIQCESCHGPASGHLGNTSDERMVATFDPQVCAYCHESGTNHIISRQFRVAGHGMAVNESGSGRESCVRCHTGKGFAQYVDGVSTTDPYFDATYSAITCAACHDPHSATNTYQLRKVTAQVIAYNATTPTSPTYTDVSGAGLGTACINCHQSRTEANASIAVAGTSSISSRFGPHHGPQGDILLANNMLALGGVALATSGHLGETHDACVRCHMYNENRINAQGSLILSGGHTFSMSTPDGVDNMEACTGCHGGTFGTKFTDVKFFFNGNGDHDNDGVVEGLQDEVAGMIKKIMDKLTSQISGVVISTENGFPTPSKTWTKTQLSAFWNAITAYEDKSGGIHNPKYVISALRGAMASLGIATAVETENNQTIPTEYVVYQNYPNPFNPSTNIKFALPKESHVRLTIYDATGREVVTLINDQLAAGTHNIEWSAKNIASGLYLYRIEAGNFVKVNKMLLVK